ACAVAGAVSEMAACAVDDASAAGGAGGRGHLGWAARAAGCGHEPCRGAAVDSLARAAHPGTSDTGERLLHGVSVHAAAHGRAALASARLGLAALAAEQVAGGRPARRVPVGV